MRYALLPLLLAATVAMADAPGYSLDLRAAAEPARLTIAPRITAPAGARLRYEVVSTKEGGAGRSSTSQSGTASVGADGSATLSTLSFSVGPQDRYEILVKVYDGPKLVAERRVEHP